MYFVYFLQSLKDKRYYIGCTSREPLLRLAEHNAGCVKSTKTRVPFQLVYFETFKDRGSAFKREWHLKHSKGYLDKLNILREIMRP